MSTQTQKSNSLASRVRQAVAGLAAATAFACGPHGRSDEARTQLAHAELRMDSHECVPKGLGPKVLYHHGMLEKDWNDTRAGNAYELQSGNTTYIDLAPAEIDWQKRHALVQAGKANVDVIIKTDGDQTTRYRRDDENVPEFRRDEYERMFTQADARMKEFTRCYAQWARRNHQKNNTYR